MSIEVIYSTFHNNYDLEIGESYEATKYKPGWLLINGVLYREEYFSPYTAIEE